MDRIIKAQAFHKPLAEAGLIPENCRLLEMSIGTTGDCVLRYEVLITSRQLLALGDVLTTVGLQLVKEG